jgi:hypothetical protein
MTIEFKSESIKSQRRYYVRDHLGSVRDVLDQAGMASYDYDPYGKLINSPATPPEFGFAGIQYHAPSGLYLTWFRAYDAQPFIAGRKILRFYKSSRQSIVAHDLGTFATFDCNKSRGQPFPLCLKRKLLQPVIQNLFPTVKLCPVMIFC